MRFRGGGNKTTPALLPSFPFSSEMRPEMRSFAGAVLALTSTLSPPESSAAHHHHHHYHHCHSRLTLTPEPRTAAALEKILMPREQTREIFCSVCLLLGCRCGSMRSRMGTAEMILGRWGLGWIWATEAAEEKWL